MNVMIVEDDTAAAHFLSQVVLSKDYPMPKIAHSAEDALGLAINNSFDLITLDVQLPGASGLEVLSVIRNLHPHAIIAVISGHMPGNIPKETAECADVVIKKPVSVETLHRLLDSTANICKEIANIQALEKINPDNATS